MPDPSESWLAIDVGGANIKAAHAVGPALSVPFELWRRPGDLAGALARVADRLPPAARVALTMTAELCDCYPTKRAGVGAVLHATRSAFAGLPLHVWGVDGVLYAPDRLPDPLLAAAANWRALAQAAAGLADPGTGLLVDVGSTTTDLIPLRDGAVAARGRTDTERLQSGELVYAGVRRTPLFAFGPELPFRGRATGLAAELFATTLDAFVTLGETPEDPDDLGTADGRPATAPYCRDRLARTVGADRETFTDGDARRLSESVREAMLARLVVAAARVGRGGGRPSVVVASGSGEPLACRLAGRLLAPGGRLVRLSEAWGPSASVAACARALLEIARASGG